MKLAALIDPLDRLDPRKDSTVAMLENAQRRGWSCFYFTQHDLFIRDGVAYANVRAIHIGNINQPQWATAGDGGVEALSSFDIILMRKDPPFTMEYIYTTYALELAERAGVLVVNNPQSLRDANEKCFASFFPQCCPPTLVSSDPRRLRQFWEEHQQVIFKPLDGMGGKNIFYVGEKGRNLSVILESMTDSENVSIMAQQWIPEVETFGDKRILLIHGKPVPYALARIPAAGEIRGNLAAGGHGKTVKLTERDHWICEQLAPALRQKGLYFVGLDVIADYLTEVNVTSPTCIREIEAETSLDIAGDLLDTLERLRQTAVAARPQTE